MVFLLLMFSQEPLPIEAGNESLELVRRTISMLNS